MKEFKKEFISQSIFRWHESVKRIEKCLKDLTEDEVWQKPNQSSNSVGNLIIHLCGNITQYIISSLGHREDLRERDEEFRISGGFSKSELFEKLRETIDVASSILEKASQDELTRSRNVQGYELTGIGIVIHVTEHLSYHVGQIAFRTKLLKDKDLGFYKGVDLNRRNEN